MTEPQRRPTGEFDSSLDLSDVFADKQGVGVGNGSGDAANVPTTSPPQRTTSPRRSKRHKSPEKAPHRRHSQSPEKAPHSRHSHVSSSEIRNDSKESLGGRSDKKHSSSESEDGIKERKPEREKRRHKLNREESGSVGKPPKDPDSSRKLSSSRSKRENKSDKSSDAKNSTPRRTASSDSGKVSTLRRPSRNCLGGSFSSLDHAKPGVKMKSVLHHSGSVSSDGEEDYGVESAVFQFDPTQADNVYVVKQIHTSDSECGVNNNDGSQSLISISEMKDHMAEAQQHQSSNQKPIFDFLDDDETPSASQPDEKTRSRQKTRSSRTKSKSPSKRSTKSRSPSKTRTESRSRSPSKTRTESKSRFPSKTRTESRSRSPSKTRTESRSSSRSHLTTSPRKQKQMLMLDEKHNSSKGSSNMVNADNYSKLFSSESKQPPVLDKSEAKQITKNHVKKKSDTSVGGGDVSDQGDAVSLNAPASPRSRIRKGHKKPVPSQRKKAVPPPVVGSSFAPDRTKPLHESSLQHVTAFDDFRPFQIDQFETSTLPAAPLWSGGEDIANEDRPSSPFDKNEVVGNGAPPKQVSPTNNQEWDSGDDQEVAPPPKEKSKRKPGPGALSNSIGRYFGKMKRNTNAETEDDVGSVSSAGSKGSLFSRGGRRTGHQLLGDDASASESSNVT